MQQTLNKCMPLRILRHFTISREAVPESQRSLIKKSVEGQRCELRVDSHMRQGDLWQRTAAMHSAMARGYRRHPVTSIGRFIHASPLYLSCRCSADVHTAGVAQLRAYTRYAGIGCECLVNYLHHPLLLHCKLTVQQTLLCFDSFQYTLHTCTVQHSAHLSSI